jgi:hypothetical protein
MTTFVNKTCGYCKRDTVVVIGNRKVCVECSKEAKDKELESK